MSKSAESVVREFVESWQEFDPDHLASFFGHDAVMVDGPREVRLRGAEAIRHEFEEQKAIIGGATAQIKALVSDGRTVMTERVDTVALGGSRFTMEVVGVFEVGTDGKIERWQEYYDQKSVMDAVEALGGSTLGGASPD